MAKKKRTKAQRSAAAKAAWARRNAGKAPNTSAALSVILPAKTAVAVKEGDEYALVLSNGAGDLIRFPLSASLLYKVSLEGLNLVPPPVV